MKIELTHSNWETFPSQTKFYQFEKSVTLLPPSLSPGNKENWFIHYQDRTDTIIKSQLIFLMIEALRYNNFLFNFLVKYYERDFYWKYH